MEATLHNLALWLESSKYILLIIGTIIEGPVVMMVSGFLFGLGQFSLVPMYFALVFGDFIADIGWYCLGRFGTRHTIFKYGHFLGLTPKLLEMMEDRFHKYHQKILIISKLTMGMGFAFIVLIVAGIFKVPFKNYVFLNLVGGFIWTALLVTIGYFVGNIFLIIPNSLKVVFVIFIFIAIIIGLRYATKYLKGQNI
ncbi:MAG: VTT domain-containing protein [Candidatus Nomurabacteria bacterium]|nr:VTT domain-containing protein [Candidatus Nomurabacteria bacterium]